MLDRAQVIDQAFVSRVTHKDYPQAHSSTTLNEAGLSQSELWQLYLSQCASRHLDLIARKLKDKGLAYYTIGSSGHEGNAAIAKAFTLNDMAFLHYRSGAFYLERAKQNQSIDGIEDMLLSLVAAKSEPISGGRHKVFGSVPLNIPPQTSTIASHLPKALGTCFSINRAKALKLKTPLSEDSIILCSFGDASFNHASAQTSFNACSWMAEQQYPLPIVWICEDNGIGISVPTPNNWVKSAIMSRPGIHYLSCDGLNILDVYKKSLKARDLAHQGIPVFLHMHCVRLMGHAGSDIEFQYRTEQAIITTESDDPLLHTARILTENGFSASEILSAYEALRQEIEAKAHIALKAPRLDNKFEIMASLIPSHFEASATVSLTEKLRQDKFAQNYELLSQPRNMCSLINYALTDLMIKHPNIVVFGEDVGKKGGVYRVTADLQARFSNRRVFDSILDETTILGTAIGLAHNGFLPIPEIQFLAYLHNAEDQLRGEAATLSYFSNGQYRNPMVIRIAGLAYQKGFGGHFHNDNSLAILRDIPGIMVACPSNGRDAALMLRTCVNEAHEKGRVVIFVEPIALYMTKDLHDVGDSAWLCTYPQPEEKLNWGEIHQEGEGEYVILSYANGYYLSLQAAKVLKEQHGISIRVVDMRWISPLPEQAIIAATTNAKGILIVDEGRRSGSLSEALMALLMEHLMPLPIIMRITGEDCFIPLGTAWEHVLPSKATIVEACLSLTGKTSSASVRTNAYVEQNISDPNGDVTH